LAKIFQKLNFEEILEQIRNNPDPKTQKTLKYIQNQPSKSVCKKVAPSQPEQHEMLPLLNQTSINHNNARLPSQSSHSSKKSFPQIEGLKRKNLAIQAILKKNKIKIGCVPRNHPRVSFRSFFVTGDPATVRYHNCETDFDLICDVGLLGSKPISQEKRRNGSFQIESQKRASGSPLVRNSRQNCEHFFQNWRPNFE